MRRGALRWIGGFHAVEEALKGNPEAARELWVEHELRHPLVGELVKLAKARGLRVLFVGRREIDRACPGRHQGIALKTALAAGGDLVDYLKGLGEEEKKGLLLMALDQIQDPHNLGAIARSALNLGAAGLILPERHSAPVSPAAVQVSAGALQKLKVFRVVNLGQALSRCKESGFWVYGLDMAGRPCWDAVFNFPLVLVVGSEGSGLRQLTRTLCDELVSVPQAERAVESLNASCAASVVCYEIARRRRPGAAGR